MLLIGLSPRKVWETFITSHKTCTRFVVFSFDIALLPLHSGVVLSVFCVLYVCFGFASLALGYCAGAPDNVWNRPIHRPKHNLFIAMYSGYENWGFHYNDVTMRAMACQITVVSDGKPSLVFGGWVSDRWPVNSPHKGPVTRKMFPFDDVIMCAMKLY